MIFQRNSPKYGGKRREQGGHGGGYKNRDRFFEERSSSKNHFQIETLKEEDIINKVQLEDLP
jgi:hypothetical protein